jgi:hypothetical protein
MQRNSFLLMLATLALAAAPLLAVSEPTPQEDLEQNRSDLERWRGNPEKYAALEQNTHAFLALPLERRKQMIKLDADLHEQPSAVQARLKNVLARYSDWLEHLDPAEQKKIREAPDRAARLKVVHDLREQEWFKRQPQKFHKDAEKMPPDERAKFIAELRRRERNRKRDWQVALRFWEEFQSGDPKKESLPASWSELNPKVRDYVEEYLKPLMLPEDWKRLMETKGWPRFPQTLVELADKHPPSLLGPKGPMQLAQLPKKIRDLIPPRPKKAAKKQDAVTKIYESANSWPGFGQAVAQYLRVKPPKKQALDYEFWPNDADGLGKDAREFLDTTLMPLLSPKEQKDLARAATRGWPDYPRVLDELARNHHLQVPWQTLPGSRTYWDKYRLKKTAFGFPALPDDVLRDFVRFELTPQERADLKISLTDPETLQRAVPTFFQRRPHLQKQLKQVDQARRPRVPAPFVNAPAANGKQPDF